MIEQLNIHVPLTYESKMREWDTTGNLKFGMAIFLSFDPASKKYDEFKDFCSVNNIPYEISSRNYSYTKKEKLSSMILRLNINGNADVSDSPESLFDRCSACGKLFRKLSRDRVHVSRTKIAKYDLSITHQSEILISAKLLNILVENEISGFDVGTIYDIKSNLIIPDYYNLKLQVGIGPFAAHTLVERRGVQCNACKTYTEQILKGRLIYKKEHIKGYDIFYTEDLIGFAGKSSGSTDRVILISQKLYKVMLDNNIKSLYVEPIELI